MAIKAKGPFADARVRMQASEAGNLSAQVRGEYTVAGLAQNEYVAVAKIPAYSFIVGLLYAHEAMGANTALQFGYETADGVTSDPDLFATVADASSAGNGAASIMPILVTQDCFVIVKQTGAGNGAGKISGIPLYVYQGR